MWPNAMAHMGYSQQTISSLWGLAALIELPGMTIAGALSDAIGRAPRSSQPALLASRSCF